MIKLKNVYKRFEGSRTHAVENVNLSVRKGELLGLIGESGCGKTTTLKLINRLEEPSQGDILVAGENIRKHRPEQLRRNIGYVFQGIGLFPHRTIEENVAAVPELLGWEPEQIRRRCNEMLNLVGLSRSEYGARNPTDLSGGQQQRVGVARALAAKPEVMLMDEPFGALDPITRAGLQDEFKNIQLQLGLTVIMVTHDMTEALLMADRIAVMRNGRILQLGTPAELLNDPADDYVQEFVDMPRRRAERLEQLMN
ncbi:MAG: ATP-binding cassette domain-containing protein [Gammaproteobacteria bacterium]|nr:ATP-binding cassette domain-containing protein [Pseudomonadales bacterium]MCP5345285.1 ATP-binding cassette domain-containing protein [Pseudomonadales bacterium]